MSEQRSFFDLDERYAALSAAGDPLERLSALIDFEIFRPALDAALQRSDGAKGGRPPMDAVMMFKALVLQTLYSLSDAQTEFQILDRRSFGRFLGLDDGDNTPDETTIWRFRESLVRADAVDSLFARFDAHLKGLGYLAMGGQIVDASIIAAPRQRMTEEERAIVKGGGIPEAWTAKPARLAQKDRDARWTLKRGRRKKGSDGKLMAEIATPIFGYKSHIGIDQRHGFIRTWSASNAARYDGRELPGLIDPANTGSAIWADTAYRSQKNERAILRAGRVSKIHFRRAPGKPLPTQRQRANAPGPGSAPPSSMSSPPKSTGWACSSAPSASTGPKQRSASPTSRSTSNASSTGKADRARHEAHRDRANTAAPTCRWKEGKTVEIPRWRLIPTHFVPIATPKPGKSRCLLFADYQGTTYDGTDYTAGASGGDCQLLPDSPAIGLLPVAILSRNLAGDARPSTNDNAGAY